MRKAMTVAILVVAAVIIVAVLGKKANKKSEDEDVTINDENDIKSEETEEHDKE